VYDPLARSHYGVAPWLQTIGQAVKGAGLTTGKAVTKGATQAGTAFAKLDPATQALILAGAGQAVGSGISQRRSTKCIRLERKMARAKKRGKAKRYAKFFSQYQVACGEALADEVPIDPSYGRPSSPPWLLPVAIGGGALVLVLLLAAGRGSPPRRSP